MRDFFLPLVCCDGGNTEFWQVCVFLTHFEGLKTPGIVDENPTISPNSRGIVGEFQKMAKAFKMMVDLIVGGKWDLGDF